MAPPRFHLFELEDQGWLPTVIRDLATDYIRFVQATFGLHRPIIEPLAAALEATQSHRVIDLCSGAAGPVPDLCRALSARGLGVHFTLTDRFPNVTAFEQAAAGSGGAISFTQRSVDARLRASPGDVSRQRDPGQRHGRGGAPARGHRSASPRPPAEPPDDGRC